MGINPERISETITVARASHAPLQASKAANETPHLFDLRFLYYLISTTGNDSPAGPGNSSVIFGLGKSIPRLNRHLQRLDLQRVADNPATRTVGHMLLEASYRKRLLTYPLATVGIHSNEPGTEFKPHRDLIEGLTTSVALTKGILRVHSDDHSIVTEEELNPGDEVIVYSPREVKDREVHSFASVGNEPRFSLACKYKEPKAFAALFQTDAPYSQEFIERFFAPRP